MAAGQITHQRERARCLYVIPIVNLLETEEVTRTAVKLRVKEKWALLRAPAA